MDTAKVSIIVPVYNVENYIHKCIDSILSQTFTDFECILVDDCTPDSSGRICDEYAQKDKRIRVIHKSQNEGLPQARKTGFVNSTGGYIQFIDSDDYIEHNMIEKMYYKAISENYDMVHCDLYRYNKENIVQYEKMPNLTNDFVSNIKSSVLGFNAGCVAFNKLIKRNVCEKIIFPKFSNGEDKYITAQTLFFSKKIEYVNAALYHYRYNPSSLVNNPKLEWKRYSERRYNYMEIFNFLKKEYGDDLSEFEPELTRRIKWLKDKNPRTLKNIVKRTVRSIIPAKTWGQLKSVYYRMKGDVQWHQ